MRLAQKSSSSLQETTPTGKESRVQQYIPVYKKKRGQKEHLETWPWSQRHPQKLTRTREVLGEEQQPHTSKGRQRLESSNQHLVSTSNAAEACGTQPCSKPTRETFSFSHAFKKEGYFLKLCEYLLNHIAFCNVWFWGGKFMWVFPIFPSILTILPRNLVYFVVSVFGEDVSMELT